MEEQTVGHAGALAGEDEDDGGYELGKGGLEGAGMISLLPGSDSYASDRHVRKLIRYTENLSSLTSLLPVGVV